MAVFVTGSTFVRRPSEGSGTTFLLWRVYIGFGVYGVAVEEFGLGYLIRKPYNLLHTHTMMTESKFFNSNAVQGCSIPEVKLVSTPSSAIKLSYGTGPDAELREGPGRVDTWKACEGAGEKVTLPEKEVLATL